MLVNFSFKIGEVKVPVNGNLEHAPVCTGIEINISTEIKPEEMPAYAELVKGQVAAIAELMQKQL